MSWDARLRSTFLWLGFASFVLAGIAQLATPILAPKPAAGPYEVAVAFSPKLSAAQLPEPGFALSLYFQVTGDDAIGKRAVDWALGSSPDLRQLALVYDWCQPLLTPAQSINSTLVFYATTTRGKLESLSRLHRPHPF